MSGWNKISLFKFQEIERINSLEGLSDLDKILFSVCAVYDLTETQLDKKGARKASHMASVVQKIFEEKFDPQPQKRIGIYQISYDPSSMSFGQYVELHYFLQQPMPNAHYVLASISNVFFKKNKSADHRKKAEYFLHQPVGKIVGTLKAFIERFTEFNNEYKGLFGLDQEVVGEKAVGDIFNKRYGWIYSATQVAAHEGIALDQVFALPVRQALNDLSFLKAKVKYESDQLKSN